MKISRRDFLKSWLVWTIMMTSWSVSASDEISSAVQKIVIPELTLIEKYERSRFLMWEREFNYFIEIFSINTYDDYKNILWEIQMSNWLTQDYIIWPKTLGVLYDSIYSRTSNLPPVVAEKIEISHELQEFYSKKPHFWLWHASSSRFFSEEHQNHNIEFLEDGLEKFIDAPDLLWNYIESQNIQRKNSINIRKVGWELRFFYVDPTWRMIFLSSTSTWTTRNNGVKTPKWEWIRLTWVSEINKTSNKFNNAAMPYAVHISHWVWVHGWAVSWDDASKWCIRLPYNAAKHFWKIAKQNDLLDMRIFVEDNEIK